MSAEPQNPLNDAVAAPDAVSAGGGSLSGNSTDSTTADAAHSLGGAMRDVGSWLRFGLVAVLGLALDLWSKYWAFGEMRQGERRILIPDVLEFQTTLNPGALFGIGRGQTSVFLIASVIALGLVGWMFAQTSRRNRLLQIALGGILAGALGNMYDRMYVRLADKFVVRNAVAVHMVNTGRSDDGGWIMQEYPPRDGGVRQIWRDEPNEVGFVRDFIKISQRWFGGTEVWPWVFNVADMLLVGGVGILAIHLLMPQRARREPGAAASAA